MFIVELIASSFLDLISTQARLTAAVRAFLLHKKLSTAEHSLMIELTFLYLFALQI